MQNVGGFNLQIDTLLHNLLNCVKPSCGRIVLTFLLFVSLSTIQFSDSSHHFSFHFGVALPVRRAYLYRIEVRRNLYSGYLTGSLRCCYRMIRGLRGSQRQLPYHAARTHLGTMGELVSPSPHSAGSTLSHLGPTGSQFG